MNNKAHPAAALKDVPIEWFTGYEDHKQTLGIHGALYTQLENAIEQGILRAGDKLATHRKLAQQLSIAVATVTKVYKAAERRGLINAQVGRGSFVSTCPVSPKAIQPNELQCINLSIIKPYIPLAEPYLQKHMKTLSEQHQLSDLMEYNTEGGSLTDRQTAKYWLSLQGITLENRDISICNGAQHGLMLLISTLSEVGDSIAVEAYCYPGIIALANQFGRKLIPIEMDEQGMVPLSLAKQCKQHHVKLVIAVASHQNPSASVMSIERRKDIAKVIQEQNTWLIDDDVYGFLSTDMPALSSFVPDRSFHLTSLSKALLPGLRVGYLSYPNGFKQRIDAAIRNTVWMPVPLALALASNFIHSGDAATLVEQQLTMAKSRQLIAQRILKDFTFSAQVNSFHLWLTMPEQWTSGLFTEAAKKQGVLVSNSDDFNANQGDDESAVRISLMSAKSNEELSFGLNIIKKLLLK